MAGGAVIAAAAAARTKRIQSIVDAFRLAGATSPARAGRLEELGLEHSAELEKLVKKSILVPVAIVLLAAAGAYFAGASTS